MYVDLDFDIDTHKVLTRMVYDHKDRDLESRWLHLDGMGEVCPGG